MFTAGGARRVSSPESIQSHSTFITALPLS